MTRFTSGRMLLDRLSKATIVAMAIVGGTAWLSFGVLAILDGGATRIGVLPRVSLLALTILIAISVAAMSRLSGRAALPLCLCLLVVLPWIPLPVPDLFLVWTGPAVLFVWGGIALCMVAVVTAARGTRAPAVFRDARRAPRLAGVLAFIAFVSVGRAAAGPPGGDEPHYLLIVQSLLKDGDIKIANNYERRDYLEYWSGPLRPHFSGPASNGELYSGHAPGLPALIAPAFAFGGYWGTGLWLATLTALGSMFIWRAGYIFTRDVSAAWFGWSAVVLTAPVLLHGTLVYPDPIGGVMLAGGTLAVVALRDVCREAADTRGEEGRRTDRWRLRHSFWIGLPVALLPWLHTRLAVPAVFLGLVLLLRLGAAVHRRAATSRDVAAFATPILLSLGGWFAFFRVIYGTFNPSAQHGGDVPLALGHIPIGLLSLLADQEFGLLVNAPVHILWVAGVWSLFKRDRRLATELLVIVAPYVFALSAFPYWFGGASPPARYLVPVVFPLGFALATLWARQDGSRRSLSLCLLGVSLLIAAVLAFGGDGGLAYNQGTGRARWLDWIAPLVDLPRAFPGFFRAAGRPLPRAPALVVHLVQPAIVWSIAILVGWILFRLLVTRLPATAPVRAVVTSGCLLTVLAIGVSVTWSVAGGTHTMATRSQLRLLRSDDPRQRSFGVRLPSVRAFRAAVARAHLALSTSSLDDPPSDALLYLPDVPAGDYQLRVKRRRSAPGELFVGIGRASAAPWQASLSDESVDTLIIRLPVAASSVVVNGDEAAKQFVEAVALVPSPLFKQPTATSDARARDAARYGQLIVFAIDDRAILDTGGFWVLAGRQPDVVVTTDTLVDALDLELRNVAVANRIGVSAGRWSVERSLAPDEVWRVRVPVAGLGTSFRIGFKVEAGLPASKSLLGCRVEIR
jgi:hypothetical protein